MYSLYLHNFRGFSKTLIPIKRVNFLVGENSTGKSSVLAILAAFLSEEFWLQLSFPTDGINLGTFDDLISANTNDKKVVLGIAHCRTKTDEKEDEPKNYGALLEIEAVDGKPSVSQFIFGAENRLVHIRTAKGRVYIKHSVLKNKSAPIDQFAKSLKNSWSRKLNDTNGFAEINKNARVGDVKAPFELYHYALRFGALDDIATIQDYFTLTRPGVGSAWVAPIRTAPKRTYDEPDFEFSSKGEHTPYLFRKIMTSKDSKKFVQSLREFGRTSGLFKSVNLKQYGKGISAPFELTITLDEKAIRVNNVGYGVSQSLPLVVEMLARRNKTMFVIQQPEVHLHPRAQAALGDFVALMANEKNQSFAIETHSDYLIDRYRINLRKNGGSDSQILFFNRVKNSNKVTEIGISESGDLPSDLPKSYRDFFVKEQLSVLGF